MALWIMLVAQCLQINQKYNNAPPHVVKSWELTSQVIEDTSGARNCQLKMFLGRTNPTGDFRQAFIVMHF